jgi:tetratricopeptide (TPR) repeat protein
MISISNSASLKDAICILLLAAILIAVIPIAAEPTWAASADMNKLICVGYQQICQGDNESAIQTLSTALKADPSSVDARRYLAYALLHQGLALQAVTQFELVRKMAPSSTGDLALLGDAYFYAGQYKKALACYQSALAENCALDGARAGLVHTYIALGDTHNATVICQQGLQKARSDGERSKFAELLRDVNGDPNAQSQELSE